ncbi:MAG: ribonuclease HII [Alkalispirochaeta sp.]
MNEPNGLTSTICGIDEVGRGPLAGPVTAAAVVLTPFVDRSLLSDSKSLTLRARERAFDGLEKERCPRGIGWAWPVEIDRLNIHHATLLAMRRAYQQLIAQFSSLQIAQILVDGRFCPEIAGPPCTPVVGGDHIEPAIMAASIVAKVTRDRWMVRYARNDERYGFDTHKGYPTAEHRAALKLHGASPIHRRTFRGVLSAPAHGSQSSVESEPSGPAPSDPVLGEPEFS